MVFQKWEYTTVIANTRLISVQTPSRSFNEEPGRMGSVLNKLGDEGWELCTTSTSSGDDEFMLLLKRPRYPELPAEVKDLLGTK